MDLLGLEKDSYVDSLYGDVYYSLGSMFLPFPERLYIVPVECQKCVTHILKYLNIRDLPFIFRD